MISLLLFFLFILPVVVQLSRWFELVRKNSVFANFENTMKVNILASACMNIYFVLLTLNNQIPLFS
ncbi:MAG: hypothetical protein HC906_00420 [Bacteroidales bacterium]|nr:hypothetical protein [Bacteroidales bacterium]